MSSSLDAEIRGDFSNFKGTDYHLAYALWLLLTGAAASVAFYRGNDLLAAPTVPPVSDDPHGADCAVHAVVATEGAGDAGVDDWIQLKATQDAWTCSDLLDKPLLANFICNALLSEERKRRWHVKLATQGVVARNDLLAFIAAQAGDHPRLDRKLEEAIEEVQARLHRARKDREDPARLHALALDVLRQLAQTQPLPLDALTSQMRERLAYRFPDRIRVRQVERALIGALMKDAAKGPKDAREYEVSWLDNVVGEPLFPHLPFDEDPLVACDSAVQSAIGELPAGWDPTRSAPRPALERELEVFLGAREPLFVLTGPSGAGKTWEMAHWAAQGLAGRARLFIPATGLDPALLRDLPALVASRLELLSGAYLPDRQMLDRLRAAAGREGGGPLVVVLDNLTPGGDAEAHRRALADLLGQCREVGAKLVVTCQTTAWDLMNLGRDIPQPDLYLPEQHRTWEGESDREPMRAAAADDTASAGGHGSRHRRQSFVLDELSEFEQQAILDRVLLPARTRLVAPQLRAPAFAPLRRPYLLLLYLDQHGEELAKGGATPAPVDVDALLGAHLAALLTRAADALLSTEGEVEDAYDAMREVLWDMRGPGGAPKAVHTILEEQFPGRGAEVLGVLRRIGVLTAGKTMRFAEPVIADWTFAQMLRTRMSAGEDIAAGLQPETDSGTVTTLLRSLDDPIPLAEKLLARDLRWREAVTNGLAQCSDQDYRVLALLSVLARPQPLAIGAEGCVALGQLAARGHRGERDGVCGRRAYEWAVQMYISPHALERYRAARALSATLDYAPARVEAALRLRLSRALAQPQGDREAMESRRRWLYGALDPLLGIRSEAAAERAGRVLERYRGLETTDDGGVPNRDYRRSADEIRGLRAAFNEGELAQLAQDLQANDVEVRFRAACALRTTTFEVPQRVQDILCAAIATETEPRVLNRLLWASYRLSETAPDALLSAIQESATGQWRLPAPAPGATLAALAETAGQRPDRVYVQLTAAADLAAVPIEERAILSEGFAYAWWTCAEYWPEARTRVQPLVEPDDPNIPQEYRIFALRGAAVAKLATMCAGSCSTAELRGLQMLYPDADDRYVFLELGDFARRNAESIVAHPDYSLLEALLLSCVADEQTIALPPFPNVRPFLEARHLCASLCADLLFALATALPDPLPTLRTLPQDERALHATWRLLEAGRTDAALVAYAEELCAMFEQGGVVTALEERERLFAELARLTEDPRATLKERSRAMRHVAHAVPRGRAAAIAALADGHPEDLLALVDDMLESPNDLPTLYEWEGQERSWQGLLVAKVYARMFDERPIRVTEARELCEQMLVATLSLPPSAQRDEHILVYETLAAWLNGDCQVPPLLDNRLAGAVHASHDFALVLVRRASEMYASGQSPSKECELDALAEQRGRGWWLAEHLRLRRETDSFSTGSGELVYVFPAVRLALVAIGIAGGLRDPAATFMEERARVHAALAEHRNAQNPHWPMEERYLERALDALQLQPDKLPFRRHPELCMAQATVLRRLGLFRGAEATLRRCLARTSWSADIQAALFYDLACGYALAGREDDCRRALEESARLRPFRGGRRMHLSDDPELGAVRDAPWFKALGDGE